MSHDRDGLFWLALVLVAGVMLMMLGARFLHPRAPRPTWPPLILAAGLMLALAACAALRQPARIHAHAPQCGQGWDDCAWADPVQRT